MAHNYPISSINAALRIVAALEYMPRDRELTEVVAALE